MSYSFDFICLFSIPGNHCHNFADFSVPTSAAPCRPRSPYSAKNPDNTAARLEPLLVPQLLMFQDVHLCFNPFLYLYNSMRKNGKPLQKQKTETPLRPSIETRRACCVFMKRQFTPAYRIVLADAETQAIAPIELTEYELRTHIMSSNEDMSVARPEVPSTSTVVYKS